MNNMKRLSEQEVEAYRRKFYCMDRTQQDLSEANLPARFEAPSGEWVGSLLGFALAYKLQGKPQPPICAITEKDSFNAQGLEGKIVIEDMTLSDAILYAVQCLPHRYAVYVERPKKGGKKS